MHKIGYLCGPMIYERILKNQTTKYLIENPIMKIDKDIFEDFELLFHLEYNGKNLIEYFEKNLYEIGLKEGKEINIQLTNDLTKWSGEKIEIFFSTASAMRVVLIADKFSKFVKL